MNRFAMAFGQPGVIHSCKHSSLHKHYHDLHQVRQAILCQPSMSSVDDSSKKFAASASFFSQARNASMH